MRPALAILLLAVAHFGVHGAAAEPIKPERTDPQHMGPPLRYPPTVLDPRPGPGRITSRTVYSLSEAELTRAAPVNQELSRMCGRGVFGQQMDGWLSARTPERRYGVAFSNGANLYDPQGRADPSLVFLFRYPGTAWCQVRVARQADLTGFAVNEQQGRIRR